jgi:hypothetical protein
VQVHPSEAKDQRIRIIAVESAARFLAIYPQQQCANHTSIKFKGMVAQFDSHELQLATFSPKNTVSAMVTSYVQLRVNANMTTKIPIPDCTWTIPDGTWTAMPGGQFKNSSSAITR